MASIEKKTIFIGGHTQLTCTSFEKTLLRFLDEYVNVISWCTTDSPLPAATIANADVLIVATTEAYNMLRDYFPADKPILIAERTLNIRHIEKLLSLGLDTKAYVVGTKQETVMNTISLLHNLGFSELNLIPYFPGMAQTVSLDIDVAITPGLWDIVPAHITQVIDVGGKEMDISTFAELLTYLNIPKNVLNEISNYYMRTILTNTREISIIGKQNETLKNRLEVILHTVQDAIVALNEDQTIVVYNQAAEKIFEKTVSHVIGAKWDDIIPNSILSACLESGEGVSRRITRINGQYYLLNANVIFDSNHTIRGVVGTFHPVQEIQELDTQVRRELKKNRNMARYSFEDIKGKSPELHKAVSLTKKFAQTELTILLEGESGTGKELFAQAIHNHSPRKKTPFVAINFAAIPDNLIESELFGYEDGAFTGARKGGKPGLFEEAHLGTIFLDEIGSATPEVQNRLLRVLEEREIRRLGSGRNTPVDVRVIAATNIDLESLVQKNLFREDLYYRICTLPILIPPLRSRKVDIPYLVEYFAKKHLRKLTMSPALTEFLLAYNWPGNVRELQNVVQYLCEVLTDTQVGEINDLPPYLKRKAMSAPEKLPCESALREASLPDEWREPRIQKLLAVMLAEITKGSATFRGVGYAVLREKIAASSPAISEYYIKKCLKTMQKLGYVEVGKTKQGTRITDKGASLLSLLQNAPH